MIDTQTMVGPLSYSTKETLRDLSDLDSLMILGDEYG